MTSAPLIESYTGVVCDLDGVIYRGPDPVPHAVEAISALSQPVIFATNNASRTPEDVAGHLQGLGLRVTATEVVTSSTTAADVLRRSLGEGALVLAVGGPGVVAALSEAGLRAVTPRQHAEGASGAVAVLQGYGPEVTATDLAEAAYAIAAGARWVATNEDRTLPTARGVAPGNGALVGAVRAAVERDPEVIGKPHRPIYTMAADRMGVPPATVLAIGDRLDTDLAGAVATGMDGLLVLTGVHGWADAAAADPGCRPTFVVEDLRGLAEPYPPAVHEDAWSVRGQARARVTGGRVETGGDEGVDTRRAVLDALWAAVDSRELTREDARARMEEVSSG